MLNISLYKECPNWLEEAQGVLEEEYGNRYDGYDGDDDEY